MEHQIMYSFSSIPYVHIADQITDCKPFRHEDRRLTYHVLIYVIKGCIPVVEEGIEYQLAPGTLFYLKGGLHHWGKNFVESGSSWIYVHFTMDEVPEEQKEFVPYTSHLQNQEFSSSSYQYHVKLPKLLKLSNKNMIEGKLFQLVELFHSSNPVRAPYLNLLMGEILLDCYQSQNNTIQSSKKDNVLTMIKYLESHTHMPLHADDLADYMNLSYKHLCTVFKKKTGSKLVEYHTNLRMNEAAKLLRETSLLVKEISVYMGYSDQLYFCNVFKKVFGLSPVEYRRRKK